MKIERHMNIKLWELRAKTEILLLILDSNLFKFTYFD